MSEWEVAYRALVTEIAEARDSAEAAFTAGQDPYWLGGWHGMHAVLGTAAQIEERYGLKL